MDNVQLGSCLLDREDLPGYVVSAHREVGREIQRAEDVCAQLWGVLWEWSQRLTAGMVVQMRFAAEIHRWGLTKEQL